MNYSSTAISNDMYVFGGICNGSICCHNDLHHFNTTNKVWRAIPTTTTNRPMEKYSCWNSNDIHRSNLQTYNG